MFKNIFLTLAVICLAAPAFAGSGATTYIYGEAADELLIRSQVTSVGTTAFCIAFNQDITADIAATACEDVDENEWTVTQNAQLTRVVVTQLVAGDAADVCDFELELAGTEVATFNHASDSAVQSVTSYTLPYNFADGAQVGLSVNTGTSCMTGGTPVFQVEFWGRYVPSDAF